MEAIDAGGGDHGDFSTGSQTFVENYLSSFGIYGEVRDKIIESGGETEIDSGHPIWKGKYRIHVKLS